MGRIPEELAEDRWQHMKILTLQRLMRHEMVPILIDLGLLQCQTTHRQRVTGKGLTVCATCENTIAQDWIRNRPRLSEDDADILDAKWELISAYRDIANISAERAIREIEIQTTRTETIDGEEVQTLTVRKEWRVDVGLLRLRAEMHEKIARYAGYDVDVVIPPGRMRRPVMRVNRLDANGERSADDDRPN